MSAFGRLAANSEKSCAPVGKKVLCRIIPTFYPSAFQKALSLKRRLEEQMTILREDV